MSDLLQDDEADKCVIKNKHSELENKLPLVGKKPLTDIQGWEDFKLPRETDN